MKTREEKETRLGVEMGISNQERDFQKEDVRELSEDFIRYDSLLKPGFSVGRGGNIVAKKKNRIGGSMGKRAQRTAREERERKRSQRAI